MALQGLFGEEYQKWADGAGIRLHPLLKFCHDASAGFHVKAVEGIAKGAELVRVPFDACLNLSPAQPRVASLRGCGAPPLCISSLLLADALGSGSHSAFGNLGGHAAVLRGIRPEGLVLSWKERDIDVLEETSLATAVSCMPVRQRFVELILPFVAATRDGFSLPASQEACVDALMHAAALVMSRCFHAPQVQVPAGDDNASAAVVQEILEGPFLVPVCDFFNYQPGACATQLCLQGDAFCYTAERDIAAGEEVYANYGNLSDAQLLHTYGFVTQLKTEITAVSNPSLKSWPVANMFNSVAVPSSALVEFVKPLLSSPSGAMGAKELQKMGLISDAGATFQQEPGKELCTPQRAGCWLKGLIPSSLWTCISVLSFDKASFLEFVEMNTDGTAVLPVVVPSDVIAKISQMRASGADGETEEELLDELEICASTLDTMMALLVQRLQAYPTTIREDEEELSALQHATSHAISLDASSSEPICGTKRRRAAILADPVYSCCRSIALREKLLLKFICQCIVCNRLRATLFLTVNDHRYLFCSKMNWLLPKSFSKQ
jgi:hypothetical protein